MEKNQGNGATKQEEAEKSGETKWEDIKDFDDILDIVGCDGKYQQLILYGVMTPLTIACPFFVMQWIFMLSVPDHWCDVPGRPEDMGLEDWKNLTLPIETGPDGHPRFSQCNMWGNNGTKLSCETWDYDRSNYDETMPSEFNWVCDRGHYVANSFSASTAGNVVGTILLGMVADRFGRKPTYYLTMAIFLVFYTGSVFFAHHFPVYITLRFVSGLSFPFMFSAPALIAAELCGRKYRSWIYSVTWMVWVGGNCAVPLVAYLTRNWYTFGIICPIPALCLFGYYKILEESPRWLISVNQMGEAARIIRKIARYNSKSIDPDFLEKSLENIRKHDMEKESKRGTVGVWTLFTRRRLAINTVLLSIAWSVNGLIYYGLALNTTNMSGNEFVNYFILGLVELPAGWLAGYLVETSGRRWTEAIFFCLSTLGFVVASFTVLDPSLNMVVLASALIGKFCVSVTSLIAYLQGTELFPTQLRSTGSGLISTVSSAVGVLAPYIIYLGKFHAAGPYIILAAASFAGIISAICLPETLNQKLPETVEDADSFGRDHKFWSFLPKQASSRRQSKADTS